MRVILCWALLLTQSPNQGSVGSAARLGHASDQESLAPHPSWGTVAPARAEPLVPPESAPADPLAVPESASADPESSFADPLATPELSEAPPSSSPAPQSSEAERSHEGVAQSQRSVAAERAAAKRKIIVGAIAIAVGAVLATSVVAVWIYRDESYTRGHTSVFELEQQEHVRNARSAHVAGAVMLGAGVALVTLGVGFTSSGAAQRAATRRLSMTPALGRAYAGANLSFRF